MKVCKGCEVSKEESEFDVYNKETGARRLQCRKCRADKATVWKSNNLDKVRANGRKWASNNKDHTLEYSRRYRKTKRGYLSKTYTNMDSRVKGRNKPWLYKGLPICDRVDFIEWSTDDRMFNSLFDEWERSGYELKLAPSIDRLDPNGGYTFGNMGWITQSENSQRGSFSRWGYE
jgi:hypothetical protein